MPADREDRRALLLAASAALFGTACSGPEATSDNHAKVTDGMSTDEVLGLMGEPESRGGEVDAGANEGVSTWVWGTGARRMTVTFKDGKVVGKTP